VRDIVMRKLIYSLITVNQAFWARVKFAINLYMGIDLWIKYKLVITLNNWAEFYWTSSFCHFPNILQNSIRYFIVFQKLYTPISIIITIFNLIIRLFTIIKYCNLFKTSRTTYKNQLTREMNNLSEILW
jgi:hypothetical protein